MTTNDDTTVMRIARIIAVMLALGVFGMLYLYGQGAVAEEPYDHTKRSFNGVVIQGDVLTTCKNKDKLLMFMELKMARDPDIIKKMEASYENPERPDCYNNPTFGQVIDTVYFGNDVDKKGNRVHIYVLTMMGIFVPEITYVYAFVEEDKQGDEEA